MCTFYIQSPKPLQTKNPIFFSTKNLYYCRKQFRKVTEFGKLKTKFTKMPLPKFAKKSSFLESRLNNTELKTTKTKKPSHKKTTCHSLEFKLIQTILIFIVLLNPQLLVCYYHVTYEFQSESALYSLPEWQETFCQKQAPHLTFKWKQRDLKP